MAFVANLNQQQKDILYSALYNYFIPNIPGIPGIPAFLPLTPSMNTQTEEFVRNQLDDLLTGDTIVESRGTLSLLAINRDDRYFFIRYNDRIYRISTNLSEIYSVGVF